MKKCRLCHVLLFCIIFVLIILGNTADGQWVSRAVGLPSWNIGVAIDACDSNTAVVPLGGGIFRTVDGGENWANIGQVQGVVDISLIDSLHVWVATSRGQIFATTNGGQTWVRQFVDSSKSTFMNYVKMFDSNNGVAMGDGIAQSGPALFVRTSDGGNTWISRNDSAFGGWSSNLWGELSFVNPDIGFFFEMGVNPNHLYKTTTGGSSWTVTGYTPSNLSIVSFARSEIGLAIPFSSDHTVYRTIDGGTTWGVFQTLRGGSCGMDIEFAPGDPSRVWMADEGGQLLFSSDTGRTWTVQLSVGGHHLLRDLAIVSASYGWLLGDDGRLYRTSNGGDPPSAVRGQSGRSPITFALEQNFPNPFNSATDIEYRLRNKEFVTVMVYDVLGREVAALVNETKEPGSYTVSFDARGLASGVYFYRITAGLYVEARRMLLLR